MSVERARGPIMSDAIMYHNEDRVKAHHSFATQPKDAMLGLPGKHMFYEIPVQEDTGSKSKTKLIVENRGYSHTGLFGVHYKAPTIDPRYNIPKYGNQRPQVLDHYRRNKNVLFN